MTKKELLEAIKDMPEDAEVWTYTGGIYRKVVDSIKLQEIWAEGKRKKIIEIQGISTI